jgi:DNA-binding CsgD family transcriptional regulator
MRRPPAILRDFLQLAGACADKTELALLVEAAARALGFEYVAVLHSTSLMRSSSRLIRYDNYPQGWERKLIGRGQQIVDPVLAIARRRSTGFLWSEALVGSQLSAAQKLILDDAFRIGIRQGYTVPANVPGEPEGSISFATRSTRLIGRERRRLAEEVGRQAFDHARRIMGIRLDAGRGPHVSPREREVIAWIARGKADIDIATILGRQRETIRTYVKSAMRKLEVTTRAQLIEAALRSAVIDFSVSIPPFG